MNFEIKPKTALLIRIVIVAICISAIVYVSVYLERKTKEIELDRPELHISVNESTSTISLTWTHINGATSYRILRNKNNGGWSVIHVNPVSNIKFTDIIDPDSETCYRYKILAVHSYNSNTTLSDASNICTFLTNMQTPTSITAQKVNEKIEDGISVNWEKSDTASGYHLFRLVNGSKLEFVIALPYTVTNYIDTNVLTNTNYQYQVRAINFWTDEPTLYSGLSSKSQLIRFEE